MFRPGDPATGDLGQNKDWANQLSYKAVALTDLGHYDEAQRAFSAALAAQRSMENRRGESETLGPPGGLAVDARIGE